MQGTIVVAERSRTVRRMVEISLARQPFTLEFVDEGEKAIGAVREMSPAVAIIDADLPGIDGYEVARQLESDPATRETKVILLVGRSKQYDAARGRQAGVDDHLQKPFLTQQLVEKVFGALGQSAPDANLFKSTTLNIPLARKPTAEPKKPASAPPPSSSRIAPPPPKPPAQKPAAQRPAAPKPPPPAKPAAPAGANPFQGVSNPFDADGPTRVHQEKPSAPPPPPAAAPEAPEPPAASSPAVQQAVQQTAAAVTGSGDLAQALSEASRETIERVAWEVIPQLAEAILKEEIARVVRERMAASP